MRRLPFALLLISAGLLVVWPAGLPAASAAQSGDCRESTSPHGAQWLTCLPASGWNGDLLVVARGHVPSTHPLGLYYLALPDGSPLPALAQRLGFAFASTSFRANGMVTGGHLDDVLELVRAFPGLTQAEPRRVWLVGLSEGGLVAALAAERHPDVFAGAYAACGAVGDPAFQVNYVGDFRVLFDYFFPGILPGSPVDVPSDVVASWSAYYVPRIAESLSRDRERVWRLIDASRAAHTPGDFGSVVQTTLNVLSYAVFTTSDVREALGGQPYDNRTRWFTGSGNDLLLNMTVPRFAADRAALDALAATTPAGRPAVPLVSLHTTRDELVPYGHALLYLARATPSGRGAFMPLPLPRYGHCAFTTAEFLAGLALLTAQ
jgi:pimeloyl-ACP methyl ester carboxylesterase